jgi:hypothetical protein
MEISDLIKKNLSRSKAASAGRKTRKIRQELIRPEREMTALRRAKIRRNFKKALLLKKNLHSETE